MSKWRISALLAVATAVLMGSSVSVVTAAEPKVGSTCTKVGAFYDTSNKRYVCNKEGKKTVWRVWNAASQSTPASKPSAAPKKTNFKAPIPITLPVAQSGVITFSNIQDHISEIPKTAWQKVQDVIASSNAVAVKHDVYVGPNTQLTISGGTEKIDFMLDKSAKLWSGFTLTKYYSLIYYNITDEKWAEKKLQEIWTAKKYVPSAIGSSLNAIKISCQSQSAPGVGGAALGFCRGGNSGAVTNSDDSAGQMAEGDVQRPDTNGSKLVHEFIHTVQASQWIGNANCRNEGNNCFRSGLVHDFAPCWIHEGQPNGINSMVAYPEFSSYLTNRSTGKDTSQKITDYSASSLRNYLYNQSPSSCYRDGELYQLGYDVGARAIEALVAIAGPQATMALFALGAEGQDFPTAFKNVYGISWSDASTILSKVLAAEYAN
jgi:hypothetical protein